MANNDYWAYLRSSNELKHYRVSIENGGSPNGYRKDGSQPVGQKRKGILDASGRYIYDIGKRLGNAVGGAASKLAGGIKEAIRRKQVQNYANKVEAGRTSYGDMADRSLWTRMTQQAKADNAKWRGSGGYTDEVMKYDRPQDYMKRGQAQAKREADPNYQIQNNARPQDAMKEGQARARQEAEERKMYEDWKAEQEAAQRKKSQARNQANLDKWGYKDEDINDGIASKYASAKAGASLISKDEALKKLKEKVKESVSKKTIDRFSRPESKPDKKTVAVDANTGRVIPGYNPSPTGNTGYGNLGEKWRKNKSRS